MATDQPAMSVNGNFMAAQPQDYGMPDQTVTTTVIPTTSDPSIAGVQNSGGGAGGNTDIPKDEVGWYFVEQYYTTMSKNPEKLYVRSLNLSQTDWCCSLANFVSSSTTNAPSTCTAPRQKRSTSA